VLAIVTEMALTVFEALRAPNRLVEPDLLTKHMIVDNLKLARQLYT
jgi:hypothetical protein